MSHIFDAFDTAHVLKSLTGSPAMAPNHHMKALAGVSRGMSVSAEMVLGAAARHFENILKAHSARSRPES